MDSLAKTLEALYAAFGDVRKPSKIDGCPCCLDQNEICTLISKPLRDLTGGELASYSESAFLTVGSTEDYLYFLPRIVEIGCVEGGWWPDLEITGRAIGETKPFEWPGHRQKALTDFLHAVLQTAIEEEDGGGIDGLVCTIARMGLDVTPFLQRIETATDALLAYYERNSQELTKSKLGNAFWDKETPGFNVVLEWFKCHRVSQLIQGAYGLT
jgi:hypothetical protein